MRKHAGTPSRRDKHGMLAAISSPGVARGRFVGDQQSGLAGSKPPPLFKRGASSVRHSGNASGNHGAPLHDRVHLPNYLLGQLESTLEGHLCPTHPTAGQADHWAAKTTAYQPKYWQQHNNHTRGRSETGQTTKKKTHPTGNT